MKTVFWIAILAVIVVLLPGIMRGLNKTTEAKKAAEQAKPNVASGDGDAD